MVMLASASSLLFSLFHLGHGSSLAMAVPFVARQRSIFITALCLLY